MRMLEFNKEHKKGKLKKILKSGVALAGVFCGGYLIYVSGLSNPYYLKHPKTVEDYAIEQNIIDPEFIDDSETEHLAQKVSYYESIKDTMENDVDTDRVNLYYEPTGLSEESTFEEFKESVQRTQLKTDYMNDWDTYLSFSEEELDDFWKEFSSDYEVITNYMNEHADADYNALYNKLLNTRLREMLDENEIESFQLNDVIIHEEEPNYKVVEFDATLNGEDIHYFLDDDHLFKVFKSMEGEKENYVSDLNTLLSTNFSLQEADNLEDFNENQPPIFMGPLYMAGIFVGITITAKAIKKGIEKGKERGKSK